MSKPRLLLTLLPAPLPTLLCGAGQEARNPPVFDPLARPTINIVVWGGQEARNTLFLTLLPAHHQPMVVWAGQETRNPPAFDLFFARPPYTGCCGRAREAYTRVYTTLPPWVYPPPCRTLHSTGTPSGCAGVPGKRPWALGRHIPWAERHFCAPKRRSVTLPMGCARGCSTLPQEK